MAVYTHLSWEDMLELLEQYGLLKDYDLVEVKPISEGVSNTNYKITLREKPQNTESL